jgi:Lon-like protease
VTQRTLAAVIALPVVLVLIVLAWVVPLPYTIYRPGPTLNVLSYLKVQDGSVRTYPDSAAQIRMVTVNETLPQTRLGLGALLAAWISRDDAVYPKSIAYPQQNETDQTSKQQGKAQMTGAQDAAQYVALDHLGYSHGAKVAAIAKGSPAAGHFHVGDVITKVGTRAVTSADGLIAATAHLSAGRPATFTVRRDGRTASVTVTPVTQDGKPHVGISLLDAVHAPFSIDIGIDPNIGGPSAGLMMSLSIYDYLTPGSLTDGQTIAGTGTIDTLGEVGAIGGIQQKIPAAKNAGAKIFLVPAPNCGDIAGADHGSMRLVKVSTFDGALKAITTWTADHDAPLPTCGSGS